MTKDRNQNWIAFFPVETEPGRKTRIWNVNSIDGPLIGQVRWFASWRKYCFFPKADTVFEWKCLRDIAAFCETETKAHKARS